MHSSEFSLCWQLYHIVMGRPSREVPNQAFGVGEHLSFVLKFGPIKAGSATMTVASVEHVNGNPCYHVISEARSSETFSLFFRVQDRLESFIDVKGMFPRRFYKSIQEGKYRAKRWALYDQERCLAITDRSDSLTVPPFVQDALSIFYFVRTQPLETGQELTIDSHTDGKLYPLNIKVHGRARMRVQAGVFDCIVIEPLQRMKGVFKAKGKLKIWLTDDGRKIPVLMESRLSAGLITAELTHYTLSAFDPW